MKTIIELYKGKMQDNLINIQGKAKDVFSAIKQMAKTNPNVTLGELEKEKLEAEGFKTFNDTNYWSRRN